MNREKIFPFAKTFLKMNATILVTVMMTACSVGGSSQATETTESSVVSEGLTPIPSPTSMEVELATVIIDDYDVPMVFVPAGPFEMGSSDGAEDEQPVHTVTLEQFYIDQFEVTNSQYAVCVDAGVCDPTTDTTAFESSYSRGIYYGNPEYVDYPVIYANWNEAEKYCEWRGARLPTEAEWEKAARGGLEGENYPWGKSSPVCEVGAINGARFDDDQDCNDIDTTRVGSYSPNGYGLYDMAGNVWEWVSDFYDKDYYAKSPATNPSGPEEGAFHVVRGGSWDSNANQLRVSDRRFNPPNSGALNSGFRCARSVLP